MSNLDLWNAVEKTDPKHTKAITGKSYQGTSPKPHYLVHKATETFGPIGIGWGFNIVSERIEEGAGGERMHIAHVRVWYMWKDKRGEVEHIGGTQFSGMRASGKPFTDEDAPKKSVTDALVKALSMIGFAGDIFMGRYDDSKYVNDLKNEARAEQAEPANDAPDLTGAIRSIDGADSLDALQIAFSDAWKAFIGPNSRVTLKARYEARKTALAPMAKNLGEHLDRLQSQAVSQQGQAAV